MVVASGYGRDGTSFDDAGHVGRLVGHWRRLADPSGDQRVHRIVYFPLLVVHQLRSRPMFGFQSANAPDTNSYRITMPTITGKHISHYASRIRFGHGPSSPGNTKHVNIVLKIILNNELKFPFVPNVIDAFNV